MFFEYFVTSKKKERAVVLRYRCMSNRPFFESGEKTRKTTAAFGFRTVGCRLEEEVGGSIPENLPKCIKSKNQSLRHRPVPKALVFKDRRNGPGWIF